MPPGISGSGLAPPSPGESLTEFVPIRRAENAAHASYLRSSPIHLTLLARRGLVAGARSAPESRIRYLSRQ